MPTKPNSLCRCGGIKRDGICDRCGTNRTGHARTTKERGYGHDWRKLSESIAREQPLCVVCEHDGLVKLSEHRHHIRKIRDAPALRLDRDNVLSVCARHNCELDALYERNQAEYWKRINDARIATGGM